MEKKETVLKLSQSNIGATPPIGDNFSASYNLDFENKSIEDDVSLQNSEECERRRNREIFTLWYNYQKKKLKERRKTVQIIEDKNRSEEILIHKEKKKINDNFPLNEENTAGCEITSFEAKDLIVDDKESFHNSLICEVGKRKRETDEKVFENENEIEILDKDNIDDCSDLDDKIGEINDSDGIDEDEWGKEKKYKRNKKRVKRKKKIEKNENNPCDENKKNNIWNKVNNSKSVPKLSHSSENDDVLFSFIFFSKCYYFLEFCSNSSCFLTNDE
jgi:hypothetical protein